MVDDLALSLFDGHVGDSFEVSGAEPPMQFVLAEAEPLRSAARPSDPDRSFSLVFTGPDDQPLDQQTLTLRHGSLGELVLFVVPIAERDGRRHYEAVINRA